MTMSVIWLRTGFVESILLQPSFVVAGIGDAIMVICASDADPALAIL